MTSNTSKNYGILFMAKITRVPRTVLENKILTAVTEENKVAILMTKDELSLFIYALGEISSSSTHAREMLEDAMQLRRTAFGS